MNPNAPKGTSHAYASSVVWPADAACKPSFMVIGAPKSGSTSLFTYLAEHPQVQRPAVKEACFFSPFKRSMQFRQSTAPSRSWSLYTAGFAGADAFSQAVAGLPVEDIAVREPGRGFARGGRLLFEQEARGRGRGRSRGRGRGRRQWRPEVASAAAAACASGERRAFEACPFYLGEPGAAWAVRRVFPEIRLVGVLRNPRERTVSAFNDYARMGRIRGAGTTAAAMEVLIKEKVALVRSGQRSLEDFDVRMLTTGVYIHGLRAWGEAFPAAQLLLLRTEDLAQSPEASMAAVQRFLGLSASGRSDWSHHNANRGRRAAASAAVNATLDEFFAPYNEQLYTWARARGIPFARWV